MPHPIQHRLILQIISLSGLTTIILRLLIYRMRVVTPHHENVKISTCLTSNIPAPLPRVCRSKPRASKTKCVTGPQVIDLALSVPDVVLIFAVACHAMWCMWGIVQSRDDVINNVTEPEFDYVGYSRFRLAAFRRTIAALGIV